METSKKRLKTEPEAALCDDYIEIEAQLSYSTIVIAVISKVFTVLKSISPTFLGLTFTVSHLNLSTASCVTEAAVSD